MGQWSPALVQTTRFSEYANIKPTAGEATKACETGQKDTEHTVWLLTGDHPDAEKGPQKIIKNFEQMWQTAEPVVRIAESVRSLLTKDKKFAAELEQVNVILKQAQEIVDADKTIRGQLAATGLATLMLKDEAPDNLDKHLKKYQGWITKALHVKVEDLPKHIRNLYSDALGLPTQSTGGSVQQSKGSSSAPGPSSSSAVKKSSCGRNVGGGSKKNDSQGSQAASERLEWRG